MSFLTGFGALLGGISEEASKIRQERETKTQNDLKLTLQVLSNIIENPQITNPQMKQEALDATRDVVFQHLFPDKFKSKPGKLMKIVEEFVGQNSQAPASASLERIMGGESPSGEGIGRGNATNPAINPRMGQGMPPRIQSLIPQDSAAQMGGMPPTPDKYGLTPPTQTAAGFVNPFQDEQYKEELKVARAEEASKKQAKTNRENKIEDIKLLQSAPELQGLRDSNLIDEAIYKIATGASPVGSTRGVEADIIPDPNSPTGYSRAVYDPRDPSKVLGRQPAMAPGRNTALDRQTNFDLQAEAIRRGMTIEEFETAAKTDPEISELAGRIIGQVRMQPRTTYSQQFLPTPEGGYIAATRTTSSGLAGAPQGSQPQSQPQSQGPAGPTSPGGGQVPGAGRTPGTFELRRLSDEAISLDRLEAFAQKLEKVPPAAMGPIIGRIEEFMSRTLGGSFLEPEILDALIAGDVALAEQIFGKGGKTLTENEVKIYGRFFPQLRQTPQAIKFAIANMREEFKRNIRGVIDSIPSVPQGSTVLERYKKLSNWAPIDSTAGSGFKILGVRDK